MEIQNSTETTLLPHTWEDIKEVDPDETDLKTLDEIEENPDCHEFLSQADVMKELGPM
ncbi:MAG: hypothetical protein RR681_06880 [Lachnospiraceae bacterium]